MSCLFRLPGSIYRANWMNRNGKIDSLSSSFLTFLSLLLLSWLSATAFSHSQMTDSKSRLLGMNPADRYLHRLTEPSGRRDSSSQLVSHAKLALDHSADRALKSDTLYESTQTQTHTHTVYNVKVKGDSRLHNSNHRQDQSQHFSHGFEVNADSPSESEHESEPESQLVRTHSNFDPSKSKPYLASSELFTNHRYEVENYKKRGEYDSKNHQLQSPLLPQSPPMPGSVTTSNVVNTGPVKIIAGIGTYGGANGLGTYASFSQPEGIAVDNNRGFLYVSDLNNLLIRTIDISTSAVSTLSGKMGIKGIVNGVGTFATFTGPYSIVFGSITDTVYVGDNQVIRAIHLPAVTVRTIAGNPSGYGYVNGIGTTATFEAFIAGMSIDSTNQVLFVADTLNNLIRTINLSSGLVLSLAGYGGIGTRNGNANGVGTFALFNGPRDVAYDSLNNVVYVTDLFNNVIRSIDVTTSVVSTLLLQVQISRPDGITFDSIRRLIYVVNTASSVYWISTSKANVVSNVLPISTSLSNSGLAFDSNSSILYGTNNNNGNIDAVKILCGSKSTAGDVAYNSGQVTLLAGASNNNGGRGSANGVGTYASFYVPIGVAFDSNRELVYVADSKTSLIRMVSISTFVVSTLAGQAGVSGFANGSGTYSTFSAPYSLVFDSFSDILYVGDGSELRTIQLRSTTVSTLAGNSTRGYHNGAGTSALLSRLAYLSIKKNIIFVADIDNHAIRSINASSSVVSTLAGWGGIGTYNDGCVDGVGTYARFSYPSGVAYNSLYNVVYVSDGGNKVIRSIFIGTSIVSTLVSINGHPNGVSFDSTHLLLYVSNNESQVFWIDVTMCIAAANILQLSSSLSNSGLVYDDGSNVLFGTNYNTSTINSASIFSAPTSQPSSYPSIKPTVQPNRHPTSQPSTQPTLQPTCQPRSNPTSQPSSQPTSYPTLHLGSTIQWTLGTNKQTSGSLNYVLSRKLTNLGYNESSGFNQANWYLSVSVLSTGFGVAGSSSNQYVTVMVTSQALPPETFIPLTLSGQCFPGPICSKSYVTCVTNFNVGSYISRVDGGSLVVSAVTSGLTSSSFKCAASNGDLLRMNFTLIKGRPQPTPQTTALPSLSIGDNSAGSSLVLSAGAPFYLIGFIGVFYAAIGVFIVRLRDGQSSHASLSLIDTCVFTALLGGSLVSEVFLISVLLSSSVGIYSLLGAVILAARLSHAIPTLLVGMLIADRPTGLYRLIFRDQGANDPLAKDESDPNIRKVLPKFADLLDVQFMAVQAYFMTGLMFLALFDTLLLLYLPWKRNTYSDHSGGFPNAFVYSLCTLWNSIQSIVSLSMQVVYLVLVNAEAVQRGASVNVDVLAYFYVNIAVTTAFVLLQLVTFVVQYGLLGLVITRNVDRAGAHQTDLTNSSAIGLELGNMMPSEFFVKNPLGDLVSDPTSVVDDNLELSVRVAPLNYDETSASTDELSSNLANDIKAAQALELVGLKRVINIQGTELIGLQSKLSTQVAAVSGLKMARDVESAEVAELKREVASQKIEIALVKEAHDSELAGLKDVIMNQKSELVRLKSRMDAHKSTEIAAVKAAHELELARLREEIANIRMLISNFSTNG